MEPGVVAPDRGVGINGKKGSYKLAEQKEKDS
jgi:hypothetical protein